MRYTNVLVVDSSKLFITHYIRCNIFINNSAGFFLLSYLILLFNAISLNFYKLIWVSFSENVLFVVFFEMSTNPTSVRCQRKLLLTNKTQFVIICALNHGFLNYVRGRVASWSFLPQTMTFLRNFYIQLVVKVVIIICC